MKNKLIGVLAVCAFAPLANASSNVMIDKPYLGVEVIQTNQDFKAGFGKKVFTRNPQDYSVFGGFLFSKHFGVEAGYEFQPNRKKNVTLGTTDSIPGTGLLGTTARMESSYQTRHPYLGLMGEKVCDFNHFGKVKFQALLAASVSHVKARHAQFSAGASTFGSAAYVATIRTYSKTKVVPMVKLSATYMATEKVGIRLSGNYRNMSAFKLKSKQGGAAEIRMKDSYGVGLGVSYSFK